MYLLLSRLLELSYSLNPRDLLWEIVPFCVFLSERYANTVMHGAVTHIKQVHLMFRLHSKDIYWFKMKCFFICKFSYFAWCFLKKDTANILNKHVTIFPTFGYYDEHTIMLPQFNFHGLNRIFLVSRKIIHQIEFCPVFAPR